MSGNLLNAPRSLWSEHWMYLLRFHILYGNVPYGSDGWKQLKLHTDLGKELWS